MLRGASRPLVPPARHASSRPRTSTTTTARSAAGAAAPPPSLAESQRAQQLAQLPALLSELSQLAASSGPRGPARALAGARALVELASEAALDVSAGRPLPSQPALLRRLFEKLGATYVKLGQFIASSPTLFPADYVKEMQTCLDSGPAVPFTDIKRIIESELRSPLGSLFESVEQTPLASASIAQVHAAVLKGSRKEVVIKVLKPGVADALAADLAFISGSVRVLEFLAPALSRASLANIAADVRAAMLDEVDFRKEAAHAREFSAFLDTDPAAARAVGTPYVYPALSTERVMTMDRIRGVPLTDLDSPETVLLGALNTWAASVVACRTFHADLHAGNALVGSDGKVYFIDFGIVGTVDTKTWGAVSALLAASASGEWRAAAAALVDLGATGSAVDVDAFGDELSRLAASASSVRASVVVGDDGSPAAVAVDESDVADLLTQLVGVAERRGVRFPRAFGLLLKQALYFDRYRAALAPGLDVLADDRVRLDGYGRPS